MKEINPSSQQIQTQVHLASNSLCALKAFTLKWALEDAGGPIAAKVSSDILRAQLRSCPWRDDFSAVELAGMCLPQPQRAGWVARWVGGLLIFFFLIISFPLLLLVSSLSDPEQRCSSALPCFSPAA